VVAVRDLRAKSMSGRFDTRTLSQRTNGLHLMVTSLGAYSCNCSIERSARWSTNF
jgi:hypothetical protein